REKHCIHLLGNDLSVGNWQDRRGVDDHKIILLFEPGEETAKASLRQDPQGPRVTMTGGHYFECLDGRGDDHVIECNLAPQQLTQARIQGQIEQAVNRRATQVGIDEQSFLTTRCEPERAAWINIVRVASIDSRSRLYR